MQPREGRWEWELNGGQGDMKMCWAVQFYLPLSGNGTIARMGASNSDLSALLLETYCLSARSCGSGLNREKIKRDSLPVEKKETGMVWGNGQRTNHHKISLSASHNTSKVSLRPVGLHLTHTHTHAVRGKRKYRISSIRGGKKCGMKDLNTHIEPTMEIL